jgi:pSer/pThr/pTyr-binding forkhead associated (FHA) protein
MKLSLVVTQGVHAGKPIPIMSSQFLIGRDEQCQLRPASPAISKRHCAILVRDGKLLIQDFDSTNGTFVNDEKVTGEKPLKHGDRLKVGPLEFELKIERTAPAVKAPVAAKAAAGNATKAKAPEPPAADEEAVAVGTEEPEGEAASRSDRIAAMLLGLGDDGGVTPGTPTDEHGIPEGSTVMDMQGLPGAETKEEKKEDGKKDKGFKADTSAAADAILRKYMRRPRS